MHWLATSSLLALSLVAAGPGTATLHAQKPAASRAPIRLAGGPPRAGAETYVIVTGLMGGVAGFSRLEAQLVGRGHRVLIIDPYHLSLDSAGVNFVDLARRVDRVLDRLGIDSAQVVGHAHGAGVALRLAAIAPHRVAALYFLDVGALPISRTKVFSAALRLAPIIARIPGGRQFLQGRIMNGLRQNAGRKEWLDDDARRDYVDPLIDNIGRVVSMAGRLAEAEEPEPVTAVVARVRAPVMLLLGTVPHPAGPDSVEITVLAPLGQRLTIHRLAGVGHFPHEEAPVEVANHILRRHP